MAYMARVINGVVVAVHSRTPEYNATQPEAWQFVQTSYNVYGGVYYDAETRQPVENQAEVIAAQDGRQRKNYAGIGYRYDKERDAFIPPTPYPSWKLNEDTCLWDAPIPYPSDNKQYIWNEAAQEWTYTGYYYEDGELKKEEITGE
jgi:hypothetical protein